MEYDKQEWKDEGSEKLTKEEKAEIKSAPKPKAKKEQFGWKKDK